MPDLYTECLNEQSDSERYKRLAENYAADNARLRAELEAMEKDRDYWKNQFGGLAEAHGNMTHSRDALKADLEVAQKRAEAAEGLIDRALVFLTPAISDGSRAVERARVIMQAHCDRRGPDAGVTP